MATFALLISLFIPVRPAGASDGGSEVNEDKADQIVQIVHLPASYPYDGFDMFTDDNGYAGTTIALLQNGKVYSWGNNAFGAVGNNTDCTAPSDILDKWSIPKRPPCHYDVPQNITKYFGNDRVVKLASRFGLAMAITESGKMYRWGQVDLTRHNPTHHDYGVYKPVIRPTKYQELDAYHIIGYGGSNRKDSSPRTGDIFYEEGWFAFSEDTIYRETLFEDCESPSNKPKIIRPQLNGATIRQVDWVRHVAISQSNPVDRGGIYVLTSTNKLLLVQNDGTTTEITNPEIVKRGGIKQIHHHYAIDNQGGLWSYNYIDDMDSTKPEPRDPLIDMSKKLVDGTLPALREFVNANGNDSYIINLNRDVVVRGANNHIYFLDHYNKELSYISNGDLRPIDMTSSISPRKIRLFHGDISRAPYLREKIMHDYAFVPEGDDRNLVCTNADGVAAFTRVDYASLPLPGINKLRQQPKPREDKNDKPTPVCVKIPPDNPPDPIKPPVTPVKPPTPGVPNVPSTPKPPGVPNTSMR